MNPSFITKKKKILVVYDDIPGGGSYSIMVWLIKQFKSEYDFYLLCGLYENQDEAKFIADDGFTQVFSYRMPPYRNEVEKCIVVSWHTKRIAQQITSSHAFDYVILNFPYSSLGIILSRTFQNSSIIHFVHQIFYLQKQSIMKQVSVTLPKKIRHYVAIHFHRLIQKYILNYGILVGFSQYTKSLLESSFGSHPDRIKVLTIPFQVNQLSLSKSQAKQKLGLSTTCKLLLFASRIEPFKGLHVLLEAMTELDENIPVILLIVGPYYTKASGYFIDQLSRLRQRKNIHIWYVGAVTSELLTDYYTAADLTIMPSTELETFGMVTLESLSYGTPVVSLPTGATQDIVSLIHPNLVAKDMTGISLAESIRWYLHMDMQDSQAIIERISEVFTKYFNPLTARKEFSALLQAREESSK